jgi:hypothetical protein
MKDAIKEGLIRGLRNKMLDKPVEPIVFNPPEYDAHRGPVWVGCSTRTIREARAEGVEINSPIITLIRESKVTVAILECGIKVVFSLNMLKVYNPYVGYIVYHPYASLRTNKRWGRHVSISRKVWRVIDPKTLRSSKEGDSQEGRFAGGANAGSEFAGG